MRRRRLVLALTLVVVSAAAIAAVAGMASHTAKAAPQKTLTFYLIPGIAFAFIIATVAYVGTRDTYATTSTSAA